MPEEASTQFAIHIPITRPERGQFYPALDGLRAVAFTLVFLMHYFRLPFGWGGVNIFFVLSGFLITGILLDTRADRYRFRNFYVRRTLRIFPLFYAVWIAVLLLYPFLRWRWSVYWLAWPVYLGNFLRFVSPHAAMLGSPLEHAADGWLTLGRFPNASVYLGPFWSLCVEEQFYLVWPWIVFFAGERTVKRLCIIAIFSLPLLRVGLQATLPSWLIHEELLYRFTLLQLDSLLCGGLIAILLRQGELAWMKRCARWLSPCMILVGAAYIFVHLPFFRLQAFASFQYPVWKFSLGLTYINLLAASLIVNSIAGDGLIRQFLGLGPLRWIGRLAYGAYVFHDLFHDVWVKAAALVIARCGLSPSKLTVLTALIAYPLTMLLAFVSFQVLEKPFLNLKSRFTRRGLLET